MESVGGCHPGQAFRHQAKRERDVPQDATCAPQTARVIKAKDM